MLDLYIKQHIFSWGDKFSIYDDVGNAWYYVEGEVFSWGKKLHVYDPNGNELAFIQQKVFTFLPRYSVYRHGAEIAEVVREFTFLRSRYSVNGLGWRVEGDFFGHEYEIHDGVQTVMAVSKEWFTLGDAYRLRIAPDVDEVSALSVALVIDACINADNG